jgi:GT2 family glycosyltransferase
MKRLTFLILTYKTPHLVRLCVQNILQLNLPFEYEIIVVDNASNDGTVEMLQNEFAEEITVIANPENTGHPSGNNTGLRVAQSEYVLMMNPDVVLRSVEDLERILQYLDTHDNVAFLGPRLRNADGTIQNSCYRPYSVLTPIYRRTFLGKLPWGKKDIQRHLMVDFDHNETREVDWLLGACLFIRTEALDEIGLMDERLFLYFGDYEWCDRAKRKGWKVIYYHDINQIFHYHKRESASRRFSIMQAFSYVTRIHLRDWITYLQIKKSYE